MADWERLEVIVRKVVREEIGAALAQKKTKPRKATITLNGSGWLNISQEQTALWRFAYPAVDLAEQLKLSAAWCASNATHAPKSDFSRFINSWLRREQNKHANGSAATYKPKESCAICRGSLDAGCTRRREGPVCNSCEAKR